MQPGMLKAIVDQRTGLHNRDVSQRVGLEGGRLSVVDVEEVVPKKGRSAYEVCHGYTMYWVMVAVLSTQITNLSQNYRGPSAGKFLHPYYVHKFMNAMRHIVGASGLSGDALDAILGSCCRTYRLGAMRIRIVHGRGTSACRTCATRCQSRWRWRGA